MHVFDMGEVSLQSGVKLPGCVLAYQTYGELNASGDNVVLMPTFFGGSTLKPRG